MIDSSDDAAETDEKEWKPPVDARPVYDQVIAELNSSYREDSLSGPKKEVNSTVAINTVYNPAANEAMVTIAICSYQESPYGDCANTQRTFEVGLNDICRLAQNAPRHQFAFAEMEKTVTAKLAEERAAYVKNVENWCDAGLPMQQPAAVLRPLRFKVKPGGGP